MEVDGDYVKGINGSGGGDGICDRLLPRSYGLLAEDQRLGMSTGWAARSFLR